MIENSMPNIMECRYCGAGLVYQRSDLRMPDRTERIAEFTRAHGPGQCSPSTALPFPKTEDDDRLIAQLIFADLEESH